MFEEDLALAHQLADAADAVSMRWFRASHLPVERKGDQTFVTEADEEVERVLRDRLGEARPGDDVLGEELGEGRSTGSARRWILDPIDGTHGFLRGLPIFASLVALEVDGELVLGMASAPALGHRWWATRAGGAFADRRPVRVSTVGRVEDAHLSYDAVAGVRDMRNPERFAGLARRFWRTRAYGDFWQYALLAEGGVDVVVEPVVKVWDLAAVQVIVEEAGGRFTDFDGVARADGGCAVASNGLLHDEVLAALRS